MKATLKRIFARSTEAVLGRKRMARLGRFIYNEACFTGHNEIEINGERLVQSCSLKLDETSSEFVAFDVGANVGEWSHSMAKTLAASGRRGRLFAFEPFPPTYQTLCSHLDQWSIRNIVTPLNCAISDVDGEQTFYSIGANEGQNSLLPIPGYESQSQKTTVTVQKLQTICEQHRVATIDLMKIDTEGYDFTILKSCQLFFEAKRIRCVQFEYNHRWINNRFFLKDAFSLLLPLGYCLGKVTPRGIEFYSAWDAELENYREGNFLAVDSKYRDQYPLVKSWI